MILTWNYKNRFVLWKNLHAYFYIDFYHLFQKLTEGNHPNTKKLTRFGHHLTFAISFSINTILRVRRSVQGCVWINFGQVRLGYKSNISILNYTQLSKNINYHLDLNTIIPDRKQLIFKLPCKGLLGTSYFTFETFKCLEYGVKEKTLKSVKIHIREFHKNTCFYHFN